MQVFRINSADATVRVISTHCMQESIEKADINIHINEKYGIAFCYKPRVNFTYLE